MYDNRTIIKRLNTGNPYVLDVLRRWYTDLNETTEPQTHGFLTVIEAREEGEYHDSDGACPVGDCCLGRLLKVLDFEGHEGEGNLAGVIVYEGMSGSLPDTVLRDLGATAGSIFLAVPDSIRDTLSEWDRSRLDGQDDNAFEDGTIVVLAETLNDSFLFTFKEIAACLLHTYPEIAA